MADIFRFFNPATGSHYFAVGADERAEIATANPTWLNEGKAFGAETEPTEGLVPVVRYFNPDSGRYLFTASTFEQAIIVTQGWIPQETSFYVAQGAPNTTTGNTLAVVRIYHPELQVHVWSANAEEIAILEAIPGARNEGVAYYIDPAHTDGETPTEPPAEPPTDPDGSTIVLTENTDTPGATTPAADTQGTEGDDVYTAVHDPTGNATTLSNSDTLDGAGGTDAFNLTVKSSGNGDITAPTSSNVEQFNITNQVTNGNTFILNFQNVSGETKVSDVSSTSTGGSVSRVINVDNGTTAAMTNTLGLFEVSYSGTRTGSDDAFALELSGAGSAAQVSAFSTVSSTGASDSSFEIANITSSTTASYVTLDTGTGMGLTTVNVSGDAALTLTESQSFAGLKTVDASAMTAGGLMMDARGSTETSFSYTGSSADDRIILLNTTINGATTLNGGGGTDTLATQTFSGLTVSVVNSASNFEVLEGINGGESLSAAGFTGISNFLFTGAAATSQTTISQLETSDTVTFASDINFAGDDALQLQGNVVGTTANLELRANSGSGGEVSFVAANSGADTHVIDLTNISILNLSSTITSGSQTNANVIQANQTGTTHFDYGFANAASQNVNITGAHSLTISAVEGQSLASGQNVAGFSSAVNVDASSFTGVLRIAGSNSADSINGGTAADVIYSQDGADTVTGNGGADQFRFSGFNSSTDTLTDFTVGTDKIGLNDIDFANTTATQAGAVLDATDYSTVASVTDIAAGNALQVVELSTSQTNTELTTGTAAAVAAYVLVHNSTTGKGELWYDADWSSTADRSQIATFDNITTLAGVQNFSNTDFVEYLY